MNNTNIKINCLNPVAKILDQLEFGLVQEDEDLVPGSIHILLPLPDELVSPCGCTVCSKKTLLTTDPIVNRLVPNRFIVYLEFHI